MVAEKQKPVHEVIVVVDTNCFQRNLKPSWYDLRPFTQFRKCVCLLCANSSLSVRQTTWEKAIELTKNVDEFDTPFIALSLELGSPLWTGDKKLVKGLRKLGIDWALDTETIKLIRNEES